MRWKIREKRKNGAVKAKRTVIGTRRPSSLKGIVVEREAMAMKT